MDIVLCGVGGQGVLLLAEVAARAAMEAGLDVKQSEVHGMAQRGGSVVVHLRIAPRVLSPLIRRGGADVLLALEPLEGLRYLHFLKRGGVALVSDCKIPPLDVLLGKAAYPDDWRERMGEVAGRVVVVPALEIARKAGAARAMNMAMAGALSALLPFDRQIWEGAIRASVPPKTLEANLRAFEEGRRLVKKVLGGDVLDLG